MLIRLWKVSVSIPRSMKGNTFFVVRKHLSLHWKLFTFRNEAFYSSCDSTCKSDATDATPFDGLILSLFRDDELKIAYSVYFV